MATKEIRNISPEELFSQVRNRIDQMGYGRQYAQQLIRTLNLFQKYTEDQRIRKYSIKIGEDFLAHSFEIGEMISHQQRMHHVVDMVNQVYLHGTFHRRYAAKTFEWPAPLTDVYEAYVKEREKGLSKGSVYNSRRCAQEIISFLCTQGVEDPQQITLQMIEKYTLSLARFETGAVRARITELRFFCQYLLKKQLVSELVVDAIPAVKTVKRYKCYFAK